MTRTAIDVPRGIRVVTAAVLALGLLTGGVAAAEVIGAAQPRAIAPQIDSVSPGMGGPGDRIEITGRGFSDAGSAVTVTFLSTPAQVSAFTDTSLTVIVPTIANPPEGFVELKVSNSAGSDVAPFRYYAAPPGDVSEPVGLKVRPSKGRVTLSWSPPSRGAEAVTSYQWRSQPHRGAWSAWKTVAKGAAAKQQVVRRIKPKQVYVFQVRAVAGAVTGPAATVQAQGR